MNQPASRRVFLRTSLLGSAVLGLGWPRRAAWAAGPAGGESLRFAFYTDIHARTEWDTPEALALAADRINAQRAGLVICGGDLITDGFQSTTAAVAPRWDAYFEHLHRRLEGRVEAAIGNHDLVAAAPADGAPPAADPRAPFRERLGLEKTYRSFHAGGCRFFLLDTVEVTGDELKYRGRLPAAQLDWLRAELAETDPRQPLVAVTHLPLLTSFFTATEGATAAAPRNRVVENNRAVLQLFDRHNLILVLQGHLHVNEMLRWRNTTFITGGAVCGKWWRGPWHGTAEGFGVVALSGGRVDWQYHELGWTARRPAEA